MFRQFCHHQGATYCLAKIAIYIIVRVMRSLHYGYVATCVAISWLVTVTNQLIATQHTTRYFLKSTPFTDMLPHNRNIVIA